MSRPATGDRLLTPAILGAVLVAVLLRSALGLWLNVDGPVHRGFPFYGHMARHLLSGEGMYWDFYFGLGQKFANRGPLYPLLVASVRWVAGRAPGTMVVVQSAVAGAGCLVVAALGLRWGGARAAVAAAWTAALWPYAAVIDTGLVEHVLYAPLVLLTVLATLRARACRGPLTALGGGALAGLAALARLTFGLVFPVIGLAVLRGRRGVLLGALMATGAVAVLVPWVVRNHDVVGHWTVGTDMGRALWVGNGPDTFEHYPAGSIDESERVAWSRLPEETRRELFGLRYDEVAQDRLFLRLAGEHFAAAPRAVLWGAVRKCSAFWSPIYNPGPSGAAKLLLHGVPYLLILFMAGRAVAGSPWLRADLFLPLAVVAVFSLTAAVFWGQPRYLAPLHGLAIALAAAGWAGRPAAPAGRVNDA